MKCFFSRALLIAYLFTQFGVCFSIAQETPAEPQKLSKSFDVLRDSRARLLADLPTLEQNARTLQADKNIFTGLNKKLEQLQKNLDATQKETPSDPVKIRNLQTEIDNLQISLEPYKDRNFDAEIKKISNDISQKQKELFDIETSISNLLNPELAKQKFKYDLSVIFAGLVGAVIVGFFIIAFKDHRVRQEIFSGQAGIQFVTLFSLVIAIILFGITTILEGKELAALLGGLSGYILGRATTGDQGRREGAGLPSSSPELTDINPNTVQRGAPDIALRVTGYHFTPESIVRVNGVSRSTSFISEQQLNASIPSAELANPGTLQVTVFTPPPGGGTSIPVPLEVT